MIRSLLVESDTIAPGMPCAILRLIPDGIRPASGQAFVDPPTAAAFSIERIDELDAGECYAETGHLSRAVRLAVRNVSDAPAVFRMTIPVVTAAFDPKQTELDLLRLARDGWAKARARVRRLLS